MGLRFLTSLFLICIPLVTLADTEVVKKNEQVIAHYKGKDGIPFPDKLGPVVQTNPAELARGLVVILNGQAGLLKQGTKVGVIGQCRANKTVRKKAKVINEKIKDRVLSDMLFIQKEYLPLKPQEAFGAITSVKPYWNDRSNSSSVMATQFNVPCLPYRIRITGSNSFAHFGKDAIRNYDGDPNGKGELRDYLFSDALKFALETRRRR